MHKILKYIYMPVLVVMLGMLILLVGSVSVNVVGRFFGRAFVWVDEVSRLAFVWLSFTGIVLCYQKDMHPRFDVIILKFKGRARQIFLTFISLIILIFLIYVFIGGVQYTAKTYMHKTAILSISVAWTYVVAPISSGIMILETIRQIITVWINEPIAIDEANSEVI